MSARKKPAKGNRLSGLSPRKKKPATKPMDTFTGTSGDGNCWDDSCENELSDLDPSFQVFAKPEKEFSENPIIAAVQRCLFRHGEVHLVAVEKHKYATDEMRACILRVFDAEALQELGILVIEALLTGDREFADTIKKAIKEADCIGLYSP